MSSAADAIVAIAMPIMRMWSVFNVAQCDGLPHNEPEPELPEHERNEKAEAFFNALQAEVRVITILKFALLRKVPIIIIKLM